MVKNEFICPLSKKIMVEPVICSDGRSYEKTFIEEYLKNNKYSPINNNTLISILEPNIELKKRIIDFSDNTDNTNNNISNDIDITIYNSGNDDNLLNIMIKCKEKEDIQKNPCTIICAIDISGSMDTRADNKLIETNYTRLDLVKHSLKTIISIQKKYIDNKFILIIFNESAQILFNEILTEESSIKLFQIIDNLNANNGTNIWSALELIMKLQETEKNAVNFLLTDGESNIDPPKGILDTLIAYKYEHHIDPIINTIAFGYDIQSEILQHICNECNGIYGFIPDCTMVGTVFINLLSNSLSIYSPINYLSVYSLNELNTQSLFNFYNSNYKTINNKKTIGPIQYGQPRDILIYDNKEQEIIKIELTINNVVRTFEILRKDIITNAEYIKREKIRNDFINVLNNTIINFKQTGKMNHSIELIDKFYEQTKEIHTSLTVDNYSIYDIFISNLLKDIYSDNDQESQIYKALCRQDWFKKWGYHYILSISKAHLYQQCINFKDPSLKMYGNILFEHIQREGHEIFCSLEPPKKKINISPSLFSFNGSNNRTYKTQITSNNLKEEEVDMCGGSMFSSNKSTFVAKSKPKNTHIYTQSLSQLSELHDENVPCFDGNGLVKIKSDNNEEGFIYKKVSELKQNDILYENGAKILFILVSNCNTPLCQINNVYITPWHPIKDKSANNWMFPCDLTDQIYNYNIRQLYDIVLDSEHSIIINDLECITLGHGFNHPVLYHPYYGSEEIINDLNEQNSSDGIIYLTSTNHRIVTENGYKKIEFGTLIEYQNEGY